MGHAREFTRDNRPPIPLRERELIDAADVGRLLSISRGMVNDLDREELMPAPLRLAPKVVRWRTREVIDWLASGCPERSRWLWRASMPVKLADLSRLLIEEIAEREAALRTVRERQAAGEAMAHVRGRA